MRRHKHHRRRDRTRGGKPHKGTRHPNQGFGFDRPAAHPRDPARQDSDDPWRHPLPGCFWRDHPNAERAPFPMCFTPQALEALLREVGSRRPESGAKGFGPKDRMGFDAMEFDHRGSSRARGGAYAPDVAWGEERRTYHLEQADHRLRLWTGDAHSHPSHYDRPSPSAGPGLGDLGYAALVFDLNEWMEWFMMPILTGAGQGEIIIHPWVVHRGNTRTPMIADGVKLCSAEEFPERIFNPTWLQAQAS